MTDIFTIIPNWNLYNETIACVKSLYEAGLNKNIIIVDNGSTNESVQVLSNELGDGIRILQNDTNKGFAGAANKGINFALSQNASWIMILNNDIIVKPDFITHLNEVMATGKCQIIAPLILYYSHPKKIWYLGDIEIDHLLISRSIYRNKIFTPELPPVIEVDFVSGCCILINSVVFDKVGLFDESFFMYAEDVDFCYRARKKGFKICVNTRSIIWHKVSVSSNTTPQKSREKKIQNQIRFYKRYSTGSKRVFLFSFTVMKLTITILCDILQLNFSALYPSLMGWFKGWFELNSRGNFG